MLSESLVILNKVLIDWWLPLVALSSFLKNNLVSASFIKFGNFLSLRLEGEETLKYRCVRRSPRGKVLYSISISDWKYPFCANLVQKIEIISLSSSLVPRLIRICRIQWWCSLFPFSIGNSLLGQIWSKN